MCNLLKPTILSGTFHSSTVIALGNPPILLLKKIVPLKFQDAGKIGYKIKNLKKSLK